MLISVRSSVHPIGSICNFLTQRELREHSENTFNSSQRALLIAVRALREQSSYSIAIIVVHSEPRILCLVIVMLHVTIFGVIHKMSVCHMIITAKSFIGT